MVGCSFCFIRCSNETLIIPDGHPHLDYSAVSAHFWRGALLSLAPRFCRNDVRMLRPSVPAWCMVALIWPLWRAARSHRCWFCARRWLTGTDVLPFVSLTEFDRHAGTTGLMGRLMRSISFIQWRGGEVSGRSRWLWTCRSIDLYKESH